MSTFGDEEIVDLLKTGFVPVAIDQWYTRSQQDAEGDFYRGIAAAGPRSEFEQTTQGFYLADAAGNFLGYNNNRHGLPLKQLLKETLEGFTQGENVEPLTRTSVDEDYSRSIPAGASVIRVNSKVLGGYAEPESEWDEIFQNAISRDNLWILDDEKAMLKSGEFPAILARRIARFHLVDNTRGEPDMWRGSDIKELNVSLENDEISGNAYLESAGDRRYYRVGFRGFVEFEGDEISRFDVVALGQHFGHGRYTSGAPDGEFPVAIAFRLADGSDVSDAIAPQGTKGWMPAYLDSR